MVIFSDVSKQVAMWKLIEPRGEYLEETHKRKLAKYQEQVE